ncbi:D-alanyl-D-alanine carboxypeptidase family protein [uncultured Leuconostoc sp.]|uniref:M15 family metallopeptidase n=1 Tax=uncultured Leuconostoc sp. TaxID=173262 RepID=UPI0025F37D3E|nr:M15 family metallopeptidase [uncultured Leuconostoc sp.]
MKIRLKLLLCLGLGLLIVTLVIVVNNFPHGNSSDKVVKKSPVKQQSNTLPKHAKLSDWQLILVNKQHPRISEISFHQVTVDDKQIDQRIEKPLSAFREGAKKARYDTTLVSAYRSIAYQTQIYNASVAQNESNGMDKEAATKMTQSVIQTPGSSEHQTGLAVDLAGNDALAKYPALMAQMDQFESQKWLIKHAADYGFVLRYLSDAKSIAQTGIDYESWHFRYVGIANAQYMVKHHLTLEAYRDMLRNAGQN